MIDMIDEPENSEKPINSVIRILLVVGMGFLFIFTIGGNVSGETDSDSAYDIEQTAEKVLLEGEQQLEQQSEVIAVLEQYDNKELARMYDVLKYKYRLTSTESAMLQVLRDMGFDN